MYPAATMTKTQTTIGAGTKIVGKLETDGDLMVDGHLEGGPLRVAGRLVVGRTGAVSCEDTEVGDALIVGLFSGTLKAHEAVRIHQGGRLLGEVMATRVTFVSDAQLAGLIAGAAAKPASPVTTPAASAGVVPAPAPVAPSAITPPPLAGKAPPPFAPPSPAPVAMPHAEPPLAPPPAAERTIPSLPSIGTRSMQRRE